MGKSKETRDDESAESLRDTGRSNLCHNDVLQVLKHLSMEIQDERIWIETRIIVRKQTDSILYFIVAGNVFYLVSLRWLEWWVLHLTGMHDGVMQISTLRVLSSPNICGWFLSIFRYIWVLIIKHDICHAFVLKDSFLIFCLMLPAGVQVLQARGPSQALQFFTDFAVCATLTHEIFSASL